MALNRSNKPQPGNKIYFDPPHFHKFKLNNGLEVYFISKTELPIVRINLVLNCGSRYDPVNLKGLTNLVSMCIDEGAGEYNALQLSDEIDLIGAHFSVYSDDDSIYITLQVLTEHFDKGFELFKKVLLSPHFNEKDFEREKRKVLTRLIQFRDEPEYIANTTFEFLLFGKNDPYASPIPGFDSTVNSISNNDLKNYYSSYFGAENAAIVIVGNINENKLRSSFNIFSDEWNNNVKEKNFQSELNLSDKKLYIVDKKDSVQTEIRTGHLTSKRNEEDYYSKLMFNLVLGGQFTSRINLNLREKHGYTYGASSRFNYYKDAGIFNVSTSVGIENTKNALDEIFSELEEIKNGVSEEELQFAKSSVIRKFPANFESYGQVASNFVGKIIYGLPDDYFETYIEKIKSVKLQDVNEAADKSILPDLLLTVLVGDYKKISEQLKTDKYGEIIKLDYQQLPEIS
jgi:zinc protease